VPFLCYSSKLIDVWSWGKKGSKAGEPKALERKATEGDSGGAPDKGRRLKKPDIADSGASAVEDNPSPTPTVEGPLTEDED